MTDWNRYGIPPTLEVKKSQQYGRGVYAKAPLRLGAVVLTAEPYVHVLSNDVRGNFCDICLSESQSLLKCSQCKFVRYCNKSCQSKDWKYHKVECKGIASIQPKAPTTLMRLVIRALQKKNEVTTKTLPEGAEWEMDLLCSHMEDLSSSLKEELATQMFGIQLILGTSGSELELAYSILCKVLCNTFSIYRADLDNIGAGLYIAPSLFNHSCMPNCIAVFEGPVLRISTIEDIQPGEQLCISYLELLDSYEQRRSTLQRSYNFECTCERCRTEMNSDSPYQTMYATVGNVTEKVKREAVRMGMECLETMETLKKRRGTCSPDWAGIVEEAERSLDRQSLVLHPMHIVTVKTQQQLLYAYIEVGDWPKALTASERLTEPYQLYLPRYHPLHAIHLLRYGKLFRLSGSTEHLQMSLKVLTQAVHQLRVVYGSEQSTTQEAEQMLLDSQRELVMRAQEKGRDT